MASMIRRLCAQCGEPMYLPQWRSKTQRYCSLGCASRATGDKRRGIATGPHSWRQIEHDQWARDRAMLDGELTAAGLPDAVRLVAAIIWRKHGIRAACAFIGVVHREARVVA